MLAHMLMFQYMRTENQLSTKISVSHDFFGGGTLVMVYSTILFVDSKEIKFYLQI